MSEPKHTPLPLIARPSGTGWAIEGPYGVNVAFCSTAGSYGPDGCYQITPAEAEANARLFVTAVNQHEALRSALRASDEALGVLLNAYFPMALDLRGARQHWLDAEAARKANALLLKEDK